MDYRKTKEFGFRERERILKDLLCVGLRNKKVKFGI